MSITPEYLYELANDTSHKDALIAASHAIKQLRANREIAKTEIERLRAALQDMLHLVEHPPSQGEFYDAKLRMERAHAALGHQQTGDKT